MRLKGFRRATILAVAVTGLLLLVLAPEEIDAVEGPVQNGDSPPVSGQADLTLAQEPPVETPPAGTTPGPSDILQAAYDEASATFMSLWFGFLENLPRYIVALTVLFVAWLLVRVTRPILRHALRSWESARAAIALFGFSTWLVALGIAISVLVGDIRALVGSLGLVGLALSWALQTPIESFTGWLLNSFQGYYRVGDRVAVGEVVGDVYRIDFLTTTIWEIGSIERPGFVHAEQPTGRLITFPNNEVLRGSIVNFTRDFPYVWDELTIGVDERSDLNFVTRVLSDVARHTLGNQMAVPARSYEAILLREGLETSIASEPQVFISLDTSWANLTIRYLVGARERRHWKSLLAQRVVEAINKPEYASRIIGAFPRRQIQFIDSDGRPIDMPWISQDHDPGRQAAA